MREQSAVLVAFAQYSLPSRYPFAPELRMPPRCCCRRDTSKVWWLEFSVREQERSVELSVRTVRRSRYDYMASAATVFDRHANEEYLAYEIRRFVKESCGLGWCFIENEATE